MEREDVKWIECMERCAGYIIREIFSVNKGAFKGWVKAIDLNPYYMQNSLRAELRKYPRTSRSESKSAKSAICETHSRVRYM